MRARRRAPAVAALVALCLLSGCGSGYSYAYDPAPAREPAYAPEVIEAPRPLVAPPPYVAPPAPEAKVPGGGILWNRAHLFVGKKKRVCGPLVGNGYSRNDAFLNLGYDYPDPDRFQIVIWDIGELEPVAMGSTICVTGRISLYKGVAQIQLNSLRPIDIYE